MLKRILMLLPVVLALVSCGGNGAEKEPVVNLVTVSADEHGSASADMKAAAEGQQVTLTAKPDAGYEFSGWVVLSGNLTLANAAANPLTFTMPGAAVSFKATFREEEVAAYPISVTSAGNGDVNFGSSKPGSSDYVEKPEAVPAGYTVALSATPRNGYRLKEFCVAKGDVKLNSTVSEPLKAYFTMPAEEVAIEAVFEEALYNLTIADCDNGKVEVSVLGKDNPEMLQEGAIVTVKAIPDDGYKFICWDITGVELNMDSMENPVVTIKMPGNDVVVSAIFELPVANVIDIIEDPVLKAYAQYRLGHEQTITVDNYWYGDDPKSESWVTITPESKTYPAWDADGDGRLSEEEAAAVTAIDVSRDALAGLGIEGDVKSVSTGRYFYGLELLKASGQPIEVLDANEFPLVKAIICDRCALKELAIEKCLALEELFVEHNYLTHITFGKNKNLYKLSCWDNNIDSNDGSVNCSISGMKTVDGKFFIRMGAQRPEGNTTIREVEDLPQLTRPEGITNDEWQKMVNEVYGSVVSIMSLSAHNGHWSNISNPDSPELKFNRNVGWAGW